LDGFPFENLRINSKCIHIIDDEPSIFLIRNFLFEVRHLIPSNERIGNTLHLVIELCTHPLKCRAWRYPAHQLFYHLQNPFYHDRKHNVFCTIVVLSCWFHYPVWLDSSFFCIWLEYPKDHFPHFCSQKRTIPMKKRSIRKLLLKTFKEICFHK
jgi:hypothetical protein